MFTTKIFLDLNNFDADRTELRRLEKRLKSSPEFLYRKGKVYFFNVPDLIQRINFFNSITSALQKIGYKSVVLWEYEKNL